MLMTLEAGKLKKETLLSDSTRSMRSASLAAGYGRQEQGLMEKVFYTQGTGQMMQSQSGHTGFRLNYYMGQYRNPCMSATSATRLCALIQIIFLLEHITTKGRSKLTNQQAEQIRKMDISHSKIAAMFGVSQTTISRIRRGESY
jgi:hypothetical protein